jgi:hypothetical protein
MSMATNDNTIRLPGDLLAELETEAAARGLSVDELAVKTLREALREQSWQAKISCWSAYGKASGYNAEQVPDVVAHWRNEQHGE